MMAFIKKIFLFVIIVSFSITVSGCKDIENNNLSLETIDFINVSNVFEGENHKIEKVMVPGAGDHTFYGSKLYFVGEDDKFAEDSIVKKGIFSFDINTQSRRLLFEIPQGVSINELMAYNNDYLFFRMHTYGEESVTCKLLINENELIILSNEQDIDSGFMPRRSLSDNYLAWFESIESKTSLKVSVSILEINSDKKRTLNDNVYIESPYLIPNIREGILSYIKIKSENYILSDVLDKIRSSSKTEENIDDITDITNLLEIELFDLTKQEKISIPMPDIKSPIEDITHPIGVVISNNFYTIFYNRQNEVYVYDHEKEIWSYFKPRNEIFSLDIYKHLVIITDNRIGGIYCYNLKTSEIMRLTSELPYQGYILTKVTMDGKLLSQFGRGQDVAIIFDLEKIL